MPPPAVLPTPAGVSRAVKRTNRESSGFDVKMFLESDGLRKKIVKFRRKQTILAQGDPAKNVMYIQEGIVKLAVASAAGKEAVVGILGHGEFFGTGCLESGSKCRATASTIRPTTLLIIEKSDMVRLLHREHDLLDRFVASMLARNIRVEEDLADQLLNSSEKRLARALFLLAQYGAPGRPQGALPKVSQVTLAEMIGTTPSRVSFFMGKFRRLGYIRYDDDIHVNDSLLDFVVQDQPNVCVAKQEGIRCY